MTEDRRYLEISKRDAEGAWRRTQNLLRETASTEPEA